MRGVTAGMAQLLAGLLASTALFAVPAAAAPTTPATVPSAVVPAAVGPQVARGGACNAFTGAYQLPGSNGVVPAAYSDSSIVVPACGPRGSTNPVWVNPYPGSLTTAGYQCVEFSRRYLYYKYGAVYNKSTNGDQIVDHYYSAYPTFFTVVANGTVGKAPVPGDVLSFSPVATFSSPSGGHTAVVQASAVNSKGNGSLTLVEENASTSGVVVIPVTSWRVVYGSFTYAKWLHAKSNTKVPTQPLPPPPPPSPTANGNFVSYQGHVYRVAGGAPIYVSDWSPFGGSKPTTALTDAQWATLTAVPADGTLLTATGSGQVYRIAGGAPVYVSAWPSIGGAAPTVVVDQAALDKAGAGAQFDHLRHQPRDGTLVTAGPKGQAFRFAGGAPLYLPAPSIPAGSRLTTIDPAALANAGE
ncbi:MAG TPA: CHAP domain-containing protein, partial [Nakamurella sp.]